MREREKDRERRENSLRKKSVLHIERGSYENFFKVIMLGIFYLQKKLKLLKKDIGSDGLSSKSARIGVGFGLIFIGFESDYFLSDSNRIILCRMRSDLHRIRTILPPLTAAEKKGGREFRISNCRAFSNFLNTCSLLDLGFSGPPFTWDNGWLGTERIQATG